MRVPSIRIFVRRRVLACVAHIVALVAAFSFVGGAQAEAGDSDFLAARDAFLASDTATLDKLAPRLKGHLLEPYVAFWQLRVRLDDADPERVRAFLERNDGTPPADTLRTDWLKSLAKRGQWAAFATEYPKRTGDDSELGCYAIQWKRAQAGDAVLQDAKPYWFSGREQPEACNTLFVALQANGDISAADTWARFRLAHESGSVRLAARLIADLPPSDRPAQSDYDRVERKTSQVLAKGDFRWSTRSGRELALYAIDRGARTDAAAAHAAWLRWRPHMPIADRHYGDLLVAFGAARALLPQANEWYREVSDVEMNEQQRAWRVRAALRVLAWTDVVRAIDAMPEVEAQQPAWRYWKARALDNKGRHDDATRLYRGLAGEPHFYGFLAAEAIGASILPESEPIVVDEAALTAFGARDAVKRVLRLSALDMRPEAQREWVYVVRGSDDATLLLAADFARRNGLYDRSINTAERTQRRHDFALRYQMPYSDEIKAAVAENHLDEALVFGVARQESRFAADVVSSAGAIGLMQLMAPTAKWVARQMGRVDYTIAQLEQPAINAQFGSYYLKHVLDLLDGLPALATAAYNAGPSRAQSWRAQVPMEGAIYVETIPFTETREYVKKVLSNAMFYQARLGSPYVTLKDRLGIVMPRGAVDIVADTP